MKPARKTSSAMMCSGPRPGPARRRAVPARARPRPRRRAAPAAGRSLRRTALRVPATWTSAWPDRLLTAVENSLKAAALIRWMAKPSDTPTAMAAMATSARTGCARHSPSSSQRDSRPASAAVPFALSPEHSTGQAFAGAPRVQLAPRRRLARRADGVLVGPVLLQAQLGRSACRGLRAAWRPVRAPASSRFSRFLRAARSICAGDAFRRVAAPWSTAAGRAAASSDLQLAARAGRGAVAGLAVLHAFVDVLRGRTGTRRSMRHMADTTGNAWRSRSQYFPGIHDAQRVQRRLDGAHHVAVPPATCSAPVRRVFSAPMPCSAEIEPPKPCTWSCTMRLTGILVGAGNRSCAMPARRRHVVVQVAVAQVAEARPAGSRERPLASAASVTAMKSAMREIGSEISCLMFLPACACASGMCSRSCHRPSRLRHGAGHDGVVDRCRLPAPRRCSLPAVPRRALRTRCSTVPAARTADGASAKGRGSCGNCCATSSRQYCDISSKPVRLAPQWSCIRRQQAQRVARARAARPAP